MSATEKVKPSEVGQVMETEGRLGGSRNQRPKRGSVGRPCNAEIHVPFMAAPLDLPIAKGTSSSEELILTTTGRSDKWPLMGLIDATRQHRSRRIIEKCPLKIYREVEGKCADGNERCRPR